MLGWSPPVQMIDTSGMSIRNWPAAIQQVMSIGAFDGCSMRMMAENSSGCAVADCGTATASTKPSTSKVNRIRAAC